MGTGLTYRLQLLILFCPIASAQPTAHFLWLSYNGEHRVSERWSAHFDASYRMGDQQPLRQWVVRPAVNYAWKRTAVLSAGYAYLRTSIPGTAQGSAPEHRFHEQIMITQPFHKWTLRHRIRNEQRWMGSGVPFGAQREWHLQHRPRYMGRVEVPIRRALYLAFYEEAMLRFGYTGNTVFDQLRSYGGVGWRPHAHLSAELGWMHRYAQPIGGGRMESIHTLVLTLSNQAPLLRGRARSKH
jgi:hypothetical protein